MDRKSAVMSRHNMQFATGQSIGYVEQDISHGKELAEDSRKDERIKASFCKNCFYRNPLAGQCFTSQPCMCCGETQLYGSTLTDALCLECAKKHSLCKHCGGDRELRERRRNWPEPQPDGKICDGRFN